MEYSQIGKALVFDMSIVEVQVLLFQIEQEKVAEWLKAVDCKFIGNFLRGFKSLFFH